MASPYLYFAGERLSAAELSAARLDGDLVEVGDGYIPADAVETVELRAASLAALLGDTLAATHLTAAWIHGALDEPPGRHTVQRVVDRRLHQVAGRRLRYRDTRLPAAHVMRIAGVAVTTPARTLADVARESDPPHRIATALLVAGDPSLAAAALVSLGLSGPLPHKRSAQRLLRTLVATAGDQDDVTR